MRVRSHRLPNGDRVFEDADPYLALAHYREQLEEALQRIKGLNTVVAELRGNLEWLQRRRAEDAEYYQKVIDRLSAYELEDGDRFEGVG